MKLLDRVRTKVKFKHYSQNTANSYVYWIKKYILFHNKTHPENMGIIDGVGEFDFGGLSVLTDVFRVSFGFEWDKSHLPVGDRVVIDGDCVSDLKATRFRKYGDEIRYLHKELDLSQKGLSVLLDVSENKINLPFLRV